MQGARQLDKPRDMQQENRQKRIDLTMLVATTPAEELGPRMIRHWADIRMGGVPKDVRERLREKGESAANLLGAGSTDADKLRAFLEKPAGNKFTLTFETTEDAWDYAYRLNALMEGCGLFGSVRIQEPSRIENSDMLTPAPGHEWKIVMKADAAERVAPLAQYEAAELAGKRDAGQRAGSSNAGLEIVPNRERTADEGFIAGIRKTIKTDDQTEQISPEETIHEVREREGAKKEKGVAALVLLPRTFRNSEGATLQLIPDEGVRKDLEAARKSGSEYVFDLTGKSRLKAFLAANGEYNVKVDPLEGNKFRITINPLSETQRHMRGV